MPNFDIFEKGLRQASPPRFVYDFSKENVSHAMVY